MSGTQETALTLARELSGAGEAEEALLELLCQAAEQQWEKRLRPGMTTEDCGKAFPCAVAFTAPRTWRRRGAVKACPASRRAACPCGSAARRRAALWRRACGARRNG